jgi:hypothetical protein
MVMVSLSYGQCARGGVVGPVDPTPLRPERRDALAALTPGATSDVIPVPIGFAVAQHRWERRIVRHLAARAAHRAGREGRYAVRWLVLQAEPAERLFFVSRDRIDGLMDSMTMPFEVRDAGLWASGSRRNNSGIYCGR